MKWNFKSGVNKSLSATTRVTLYQPPWLLCISGCSDAAIRRRGYNSRGRNSVSSPSSGDTCDATGSDGFAGFGSKPAKVLGKQQPMMLSSMFLWRVKCSAISYKEPFSSEQEKLLSSPPSPVPAPSNCAFYAHADLEIFNFLSCTTRSRAQLFPIATSFAS